VNNIRQALIWILVNVCRFVLAAAFIFSGFVKLIDPRGTEYKIQDYGEVFGLSAFLPQYVPLVLSVLLALFEFAMGIYMFFGTRRLRTTRLLLVFLTLVTFLTLYLAIENPIRDCGCFGDAVVLSNWQTFAKNCILWIACLVTAIQPQRMTRFISERNQWMISFYAWLYAFGLTLSNLYGLPVMDFRPYHIGADLLQLRSSATNSYETFFVMRKDGIEKEYSLEDYPDSTWTLVDTRMVMHDEEESQALHDDFVITSIQSGAEVTDSLLSCVGYKFLLVLPDIAEADDGAIDRIASLYDFCQGQEYHLWGLTAGSNEEIERWRDLTGAEYPFYRVDDVILKTMVRSNPGLILLDGSVVVNKWPSTNLPTQEELRAPLDDAEIAHPAPVKHSKKLLDLILWFVIPLLFLTLCDRLWEWRKKRTERKNIC